MQKILQGSQQVRKVRRDAVESLVLQLWFPSRDTTAASMAYRFIPPIAITR